ncbi:carbohydrate ABC transporter permease [Fictibacillus enclensis]|uniref:Sugar ABC transporter permease n=1 Tax=Fictibacillus enclensis TaxID=1017270 RepID=A0A0V8JF00_9BACL|nr:carbohydrate ABC transporter permease [Fictibacillus enclensis]KSU85530.1 sugar ABC transporter permease [Fictibacillus enclensis]MDM5199461.1 carbohydrate ABC transporter permease [Fictibacillus enclensis]WHY70196.1 carbohydrate ABC transporter permease [Fictibacillus enclensis]SCB98345.1 carbohydrate ABC transporter membrane protein 2, CUT1 family (TC 3.A.1.1.-) [Fictibacillus enclensis]
MKRKSIKVEKVLPYSILTVIGVLFLLPLLWVVVASVDPNANSSIKVPSAFTMDNFKSVITDPVNIRAFIIGLLLSMGQGLLVVLVAGLAAYPLSRYQLRYKKPFMFTILFMTSLPITAVMVPVYQLFIYMKLQDSLWGTMFFLTAAGLPYAIWMLKNFMDAVPLELEESAWIDGASVWQGLKRIVAPLMIPGICTVGIFTFSGSWGNFFVPYILIQTPEKLPASVTIYQFFGNFGMVEYGKLAAFSIMYTFPAIVLYIFSQRFMSQGFSLGGASKG